MLPSLLLYIGSGYVMPWPDEPIVASSPFPSGTSTSNLPLNPPCSQCPQWLSFVLWPQTPRSVYSRQLDALFRLE